MSQQAVVLFESKSKALVGSSHLQRAAVHAVPDQETIPLAQTGSAFGHDFSRVSTHNAGPAVIQPQLAVDKQEDSEEIELQGESTDRDTLARPQVDGSRPGDRTGIPNPLRAGLEALSGLDLSGVRVHYNSPRPAQLNALAYTQGQSIHLGPGQDGLLQHEGWHAVQQMQGRVRPTAQAKGIPINVDARLEEEADAMGKRALQGTPKERSARGEPEPSDRVVEASGVELQQDATSMDMASRIRDGSFPFRATQLQPAAGAGAVEVAALAVDITDKVLSSAGGGSDLDITVDEMSGMFYSRTSRSAGGSLASSTQRKAVQFEYLLESFAFREDLIRVKVIMDYEVDSLGVGNISFALVEAHDSGAGWGGRFDFNLTPRDAGQFGEVTLTASFDVSGWIGSVSGSFTYAIAPYGDNIYLLRSVGDVGGWSGMNEEHFEARSV